ncbi:40S ribosomal protein S10 [Exaiptasia diaphana]|uniref:Plectin/eS10 N-terminal domain-containing protein n=1 Tax=Exaiptasia diaphana TaxID=2652724 RepID=A0A913WVH4_EXADI|nr:40S ribosomal protein S10 [Exaiptasia diaphana]
MLIPKKNRIAIYEYLFKEGVCVAKKDRNNPKHKDIENVPNLHVTESMKSLKSRGYVTEQFSWKYYYWYLTNEGITYLRDYLHLPPEIVPSTLRRQTTRAETARPRPKGMDSGPRGPDSSDRDTYRRGPPGGDPKGGAGTDFKPEFRGGYGRGRPGGGFGAPPPQ